MQRLIVLASAAALCAAAAPALAADPAKPAAGPQCFRVSQIQNHTKGDAKTLYLSVKPKRQVYRLGMSGSCLAGVNSGDPLVLETVGGTDMVCRPLDLDLKVKVGAGGLTPCIIKDITRLTPDQVAALPPKVRP
ncbi:DUF6491 family protein [Phenylobacterium sp.]|uniref:DUF6491 family protein n=1 Tax=Phenylobacterium sp. TaxID=1871053 RepID=UPI0035B2C866